jgi:hypothetical protein
MAKFGNAEMERHYNSTRGNPSDRMSQPKHKSEEKQDFPEHDEKPIEESVDEHGPAEHIEMHTHHKDGHVHKARHHDHQSAHDHVSKAFGEQPEHEAGGAPEYDQPSSIPTLNG